MSNLVNLSSAAQRNIVQNSPYVALLSSSNCNTVRTSRGSTAHSVVSMKQVVYDYLSQTKELALALKRSTLKETVNEVYKYLYSHYQYKADGELQQLRSPECSFAERFNGIDCKNYSILASSILINMGIKNIIRRVKQPGFNPDMWTHVYIVIPKDQKNLNLNKGKFVIDGTLHENKEVEFIKKHDTLMVNLPHSVLNAPVQSATNSVGLFSAKRGFNSYLNYLKTNSIASLSIIKLIENTMYSYINLGIDPLVYYNEDGIIIENELILYAGNSGLNGDESSGDESSNAQKTKEFLKSEEAKDLFKKIKESGFISKTFGAVFANGFNLSCWNSTFTPAKVQTEISKVHQPFFEKVFQEVQDAFDQKNQSQFVSRLNFLIKAADISYDMYANKLPNGANWRSCSRQAINIYVEVVTAIKAGVDMYVEKLEAIQGITVSKQSVPSSYTYSSRYTKTGSDHTWSEAQHGKATYRTVNVSSSINVFQENTGIEKTTGGGNNNNNNGNTMTAPNNTSQAGFGLIPMLLLGGVLLGGYSVFAKKKTKN